MGKNLWECTRLFTRRAKDPIGSFNVAKLSHPEKTKIFERKHDLNIDKDNSFKGNSRCVNILSVFDDQSKVSSFLTSHEHNYVGQGNCAVKGYVTNQLAANDPLEDTRAEAKFIFKNGMMFGVYDGHGGPSCARVVAKRLLNYIALPLLPPEQRKKYLVENDEAHKIIEPLNDLFDWRENRAEVYNRSLKQWASSLDFMNTKMGIAEAIKKAFDRLDCDIGKAAEEEKNKGLSLGVAMSGAVACVAVISGLDLHLASAGDCQAVLGEQRTPGGSWHAKKLTNEHTCDNEAEVVRIKTEHPPSERLTLIQEGRLFQSLVPLRSFGDYRYKWTAEQLEKLAVPKFGRAVIPPNYATPPYLIATPEVNSMRLSEKDKFLVIASDGLWDILSPQMVVQLVGDHMSGKPSVLKLQLHKFKDLFPGKESKGAQELRPVDKSAATHLIRAALGGDHEVVSKQLSFPMEHVRIIRDDMTVTVIFFDSEYIAANANENETGTAEGVKRNTEVTEEEKPPEIIMNTIPIVQKPMDTLYPPVVDPPVIAIEKKPEERVGAKWDPIEPDETGLNFDLDKAVEEGGYSNKLRTLKKNKKFEKVLDQAITKMPMNFNTAAEKENFKTMQILSLRNENFKDGQHVPLGRKTHKEETRMKQLEQSQLDKLKIKISERTGKE